MVARFDAWRRIEATGKFSSPAVLLAGGSVAAAALDKVAPETVQSSDLGSIYAMPGHGETEP